MDQTEYLQRYLQIIEAIVNGNKPLKLDLPNLPTKPQLDDFIKNQQPTGAFLPPDPKANPESRWYNEMVILHAMSGHALISSDLQAHAAVREAAEYHLREIQPDHATADPWGLLAYIQYAPSLADQVLHAMQMQYADGVQGTPLLLLHDVLYGLRELIRKKENEQRSGH